MLPLVKLEQEQIDRIVQTVPGGSQNIQDIYPLTPVQEGILFHHMLSETGDTYVVPTLLEFDCRARLDAFIDALQTVVNRNDVLRSAFQWEQLPRPVQVVYRQATVQVEEIPLAADRDPVEQLREWLEPARQRLELRQAPLVRLRIAVGHAGPVCYGVLQLHHLVFGHDSLASMSEEIGALLQGREQDLPEPIQYRDHVAQVLASAHSQAAQAFFAGKLGDIDEPIAPFGLLNVRADSSQIDQAHELLDSQLARRIRTAARRQRVSTATLFHLAWGLVVAHTSGRENVVFGTVLLGRLKTNGGTHHRMGIFLNTLPLCLRLQNIAVGQAVQQVQQELLQLLGHEQVSLAEAQRCSGIAGSAPLFSSLLNYRHSVLNAESQGVWARVPGVRELMVVDRTNYPITASVDDFGEEFALTAQTDRRVQPERIIGYLRSAIQSLVEALEVAPQTPALALSILPQQEREKVISSFNATHEFGSQHQLVHELFEQQVERTPDAVAVVFEEQSVTYAELNAKANQLGRYLRARQVGPDQLVAVCTERGVEMIVALLGILKAGGAYIPLDPSYPTGRLAQMLEDARPKVLLTQERLKKQLPHTSGEVIALDGDWSRIAQQRTDNLAPPDPELNAHRLAYVIYTSGSTGTPKGVMVEHAGVVNFLTSMRDRPGIAATDRLLAVTTVSFDIAALEIYLPLVNGARLFLASRETALDANRLMALLEENDISILQATPATWQLLLSAGWQGRANLEALCGGEALSKDLATTLCSRVGALWNLYGPTETTIWSCRWKLDEPTGSAVEPIGHPLSNTQVYILDSHAQPVPVGVAGEIYIGGAGVARGYLNRPELTAQRFLPDPFSATPGARLYRTGDLGRWRPDGAIEYLGRNDHQIKIRGFRIELGEIESQLLQHPQVKEAVVLAREDEPGDKRLLAYVTVRNLSETGSDSCTSELREHLKRLLPDQMIPNAFVILQNFPLTPNGKLDRRALPAPDSNSYVSRRYQAPQGPVEEMLARIWSETLKVERLGRDDDFFEQGGHSLLGMKLIEKVAQRLAVRPPVVSLFQYPTVRQMAQLVEELSARNTLPAKTAATDLIPLVPRTSSEYLPLTFSQQWLWSALQLESHYSTRSVCAAARLTGRLNVDALRRSFTAVVRRHDSLRTRIVSSNGEPRQEIDPPHDYELDIVNLTTLSSEAREIEARRLARLITHEPVALATGPLFAARLCQLTDHDHVLVVATDHMISDAASIGILLRDLWTLYAQTVRDLPRSLPQLPVQFADYALWQYTTNSLWLTDHEAYWTKRLSGCRRLQLPEDTVLTQTGARIKLARLPIKLGTAVTAGLRELSRRERTTLVMSALTAYVALLSQLCRETDFVVTFMAMGRLQPEVAHTIGYFNAPLFLRMELARNDSYLDLLRKVTGEYSTAYQHSDSGRVAAQSPRPDFVWNPRFNWIPHEFGTSPLNTLPQAPAPGIIEQHRFEIEPRNDIEWGGELELALAPTTDGITGTLSYRADRFAPDTMERFRSHFEACAGILAAHPDTPLTRTPATYPTTES
jgi:amino acid adenylation domain-containing protein